MLTYEQALRAIFGRTDMERGDRPPYSERIWRLERVHELLHALGDPHFQYPAVHVAGTKGKGSTTAMIVSGLRAAGLRTGMYTSPHLHTVRERVQVDGAAVSREDFAAVVDDVAAAVERVPGITSFEALTAAGLLHFRRAGVDVAVLEVGLGGRLDATNVVEPFVTAITSISHDHMAILGDSLADIAAEKAGIIKPGVPVVSARQPDGVSEVIAQRAQDLGCLLEWVGEDWCYRQGPGVDSEQAFRLFPPAHLEEAPGTTPDAPGRTPGGERGAGHRGGAQDPR